MYILTLNAGSSSLKFAVFDAQKLVAVLRGQVSNVGDGLILSSGLHRLELPADTILSKTLPLLLSWLSDQGYPAHQLSSIGHRIVHGGTEFTQPIVVDHSILQKLDALRALAPLHLPFGLGMLRVMKELLPELPNIACFDTAFHSTQGNFATRLPLPRVYHDKGYRRYGFHGLNYEHVVRLLPSQMGQPLPYRLLAAHLGSGASMAAIVEGKSVATTMGFSTADGLVMGTRTGSLDPGVLIALMRDENMGPSDLEDLLYRRSGLLGLSGISADMQVLLSSDRPEAAMAIDYYCYAAARYAGSLIVAMNGIDGVVFTGGIGENSSIIRDKIMAHLRWLNIGEDKVHVVRADEEATIARHAAGVLALNH